MQSRLLAMLGNLPSSHRLYPLIFPAVGQETTSVLYEQANNLRRMAIGPNVNGDAFPELKTWWTVGPTIPTEGKYLRPADCISVEKIMSAGQEDLPDWENIETNPTPLTYRRPEIFDVLTKGGDNATLAYASIYTFSGRWIKIWPTPDVDHIDWHHVYGVKGETAISDPGDSFTMDEHWHPIVVKLSAAEMASLLGWAARAQQWMGEALTLFRLHINPNAAQMPSHMDVHVDGVPTYSSVHEGDVFGEEWGS